MSEIITTVEAFNAYPNGTVFRDGDGWIHTKINDGEIPDGEGGILPASTYDDGDGGSGTFYRPWDYRLEVLSAPRPARPTIDFSGDSRATHRDYARLIDSRILDEQHRAVLRDVANGEADVDAYALNAALIAAMRSGLTRFGQSMERRKHGKRVAALAHIVQAVLENHADGLPAYAEGERSRKIEALEAEREEVAKALADARTEVERHVEETARALGEAEELRTSLRGLEEHINDLVAALQHFAPEAFANERVGAFIEGRRSAR